MTRSHILFLNVSGIAVSLVLWEIAGRIVGPSLLAAPSVVIGTFLDLLFQGDMLRELFGSLRQMLVGFGLACIIGMPLGALMGRIRLVDALFHPWVSMVVVTSVAALAPLFILIFGTGFEFRVAIVFVASFGYIVLTAFHGARGIDPKIVDVARSFAVGPFESYRQVILPALFPYLITGARLGLIHAIRAMVMAEMFVLVGYGGLIFQSGQELSTAPLISYLVSLMAVSILANSVLGWTGRRLAPWYDSKMSR
ncbi:ABC transporter permease [Roseibium sediminicola]|uniref:ABC transporter permease subunit n=1 Tax=Roseibium sediminicola TaxID=2933272 RepID=A0ABT0H3Y4_9HYPH|nr:ABC transporter permease subunit [Roseibium sp. CAU 1639]MCK7616170.1 ABC transporter permease subunit [Roseibium sp. CAU 1639]